MTRKCPLRCASPATKLSFSGAVHPAVLVALFGLFLSAVFYLYALNRSAVQGYETKRLEQEIASYQKENSKLRITEAELRSLSRVEAIARDRDMTVSSEEAVLLEHYGPVALR